MTYPPDPLPLGIFEGKGEYNDRGLRPLSLGNSGFMGGEKERGNLPLISRKEVALEEADLLELKAGITAPRAVSSVGRAVDF